MLEGVLSGSRFQSSSPLSRPPESQRQTHRPMRDVLSAFRTAPRRTKTCQSAGRPQYPWPVPATYMTPCPGSHQHSDPPLSASMTATGLCWHAPTRRLLPGRSREPSHDLRRSPKYSPVSGHDVPHPFRARLLVHRQFVSQSAKHPPTVSVRGEYELPASRPGPIPLPGSAVLQTLLIHKLQRCSSDSVTPAPRPRAGNGKPGPDRLKI